MLRRSPPSISPPNRRGVLLAWTTCAVIRIGDELSIIDPAFQSPYSILYRRIAPKTVAARGHRSR
jgi:hypothetical protein